MTDDNSDNIHPRSCGNSHVGSASLDHTIRLGDDARSRGDLLATSLLCKGDKLLEHEFARGAGKFVNVGGCEALGGDWLEDWRKMS